jgi:hypothetical protein
MPLWKVRCVDSSIIFLFPQIFHRKYNEDLESIVRSS